MNLFKKLFLHSLNIYIIAFVISLVITFLYMFLPLTLLVYYIVPRKAKNAVLLIASLLFYFFGEPVYTVLLLFSSVSDFIFSSISDCKAFKP